MIKIGGILDAGASSVILTSETKALIKARGTQSRIPRFHLSSKRIVSPDDARIKSARIMKGKFATISVGRNG